MGTTSAVRADPSNGEQFRSWNGDEGAYWADHADRFDRAVDAYHDPFFTAAAIAPTDRVLDIGCGNGATTCDAARAAPDGSALGVDLSARMLAVARQRALEQGVANATFAQADAQIHPFAAEGFDVAISRTGAMFFGDPVAAFTNIGRALAPGGRLALMAWQPLTENEWIREISDSLAAGRDLPSPPPDGPSPFSLSEPDRVRAVLTASGFDDVELTSARHGMWFGPDAADAQAFVLGLMGWRLDGLDDDARAGASDELLATMGDHQSADGVVLGSAAWIITATRR